MSLFKLTIAEDETDKRSLGYQNLRSMLYGLALSFSVTICSGFWYGLVPHAINWNASQTILILHLAAGVMALFTFMTYFVLHQQQKEQCWWWLLMPWKLRRAPNEELRRLSQRRVGHILSWNLIAVFATGIVIALPGLLFYLDIVWMQGYYTSQILADLHFWASVTLLPLLLFHMLWIARKKR